MIYMSRHVVFDEMVYPFLTKNLQATTPRNGSNEQVILGHRHVHNVLNLPHSIEALIIVVPPSLDDGTSSAAVVTTQPTTLINVDRLDPSQTSPWQSPRTDWVQSVIT